MFDLGEVKVGKKSTRGKNPEGLKLYTGARNKFLLKR